MRNDKNKAVRAAERFLAQGKIPAAIEEYESLVEQDPEDFTSLNTLGDLYVRVGNNAEAIERFMRVAEHYREQGFALKAIAMYKKVMRLTPGAPEVAAKLAELYESQGLVVEARQQLLIVADAHTRARRTAEALSAMRRIADLDPHNIEIRLRLAESFERERMSNEACEAYAEAGARLLARGDAERALDSYIKAVSHNPEDMSALHGFVESHIALGTPDEAAAMLERINAEQPANAEILSILARAQIEAEDAPAAARTIESLVARDPESYLRFCDLAHLHLKQNSLDAAVQAVGRIIETALARRTESFPLELIEEILARDPSHLDALRLLVRAYLWLRDDERARAALERLADAAHAAGDSAEERSALAQLARFAPDNETYRARLEAAGGAPESFAASDFAAAGVFDSSAIETTQIFNGALEGESGFETHVFDSAPPIDSASAFDNFGVDANGATAAATDETAFGFNEFDLTAPTNRSFAPKINGAASPNAGGAEAASPETERIAALLRDELESVDFYIAQGYADIACETLNMLERQYGAHPEIAARRAQLNSAGTQASDANPTDAARADGFDETAFFISAPENESSADAAHAASSDAMFFSDDMTPFVASNANDAKFGASNESVAVASQANGSHSMKATSGSGALDPGLAEVFDEFRSAVEEDEPASAGDYETHYNLGLAYKEMDLLDEAVEEFQTAVGLVSPQDGTPRYLHCCNLLGHCFMQKKMARLAAMWFKKGLNSPGHTEEEYQALRYELGAAYELMGDLDRAIETFSEVYGVNVNYRGVAEKLQELQAQQRAMAGVD